MSVGEICAQVTAATMATLGVIALLRWLKQMLVVPRQVTVAITVNTKEDMEQLDILLAASREVDGICRGVPTVVLIPRRLLDGGKKLPPEILTRLRDRGAVGYIVDEERRCDRVP